VNVYFVDTSFWIALVRKRDQYHARAVAWYQFLVRSQSTLVTTEAVLWEWLNALSNGPTRAIAAEGYRRAHADPNITVVSFDPQLVVASIELYRDRRDKDWSLTDCLSFVVMQNHGISGALTTDHHFGQANFHALMLAEPPDLSR